MTNIFFLTVTSIQISSLDHCSYLMKKKLVHLLAYEYLYLMYIYMKTTVQLKKQKHTEVSLLKWILLKIHYKRIKTRSSYNQENSTINRSHLGHTG